MWHITVIGDEPYDLTLQKDAEATAEGGNVALTLPVFALGMPQNVFQIRIALTADQALQIREQLDAAVEEASENARRGR
jgi:hypothetical protein